MQLNSREKQYNIFIFNNLENVMRGYHIQNGSCCQFVVIAYRCAKWCSMGENAFHVVFQERRLFSHSSAYSALATTRIWAGYGELTPGPTYVIPFYGGNPVICQHIPDIFVHVIILCLKNTNWNSMWQQTFPFDVI